MTTKQPSDTVHRDLSGEVLGGEYRIERKLGMGGMSHVYLAHQLSVDRPVVVKVMIPPSVDVERWKGRFMREARAASRIRHGGVVTIYSFGEQEGVGPYIAMEYVEGRSLRQLIEDEAPLEPMRAARLVAQGCRALHAAHEFGVVHRDLKPDNLMVEVEDGRERARVLDFGVAKAPDTLVETLDGHVVGTPAYMAPEQARDQEVDGRADLYAMGIILFELMTGRRPFSAPTAVAVMLKHVQAEFPAHELDAPAELVEVLCRACAKDRDDRWATAQAFAEALESVVETANTPSGLLAVTTDDVEVGPQTPGGVAPLEETATPSPAGTATIPTPTPTNPGTPQVGEDIVGEEIESEKVSAPVEPTLEGMPSELAAPDVSPGEGSAHLALVVSLGALLLAVVAVGFMVMNLPGETPGEERSGDEAVEIELFDAGPQPGEETEPSPIVNRAKTVVFESRTMARGASEKPPAEPEPQEVGRGRKEEVGTTPRSPSAPNDEIPLLAPPQENKDLVDPFSE